MAQSISQEAIGATGLPGATAASRHAGATALGAPTSGTFAMGDYVVDQSGSIWFCTTAGSPGNWIATTSLSYDQYIAALNPIAWYKLNDNAGSSGSSDSSLGGRFGTTVSGTVTFGATGPITGNSTNTAATFTGSTPSSLFTTNNVSMNLNTQSLTFSAWVKVNGYPASGHGFVIGNFPNIGIDINGSGAVQSWLNGYSSSAFGSIPLNTWTHIVVAYSGAGSSSRTAYINGVQVGTESSGTVIDLSSPLTLGGTTTWGSYSTFLNGSVAEAVVFPTTLNAAQILQLYNSATRTQLTPAQLGTLPINENIAGKNFIINGGMDIAQRGTTVTNSGGVVYTLDRWSCGRDSNQNNMSVSQVSSSLTGIQYSAQVQRTSGDTQTGNLYLGQAIETKNSYSLAGQTVTLSFWAKCGANFSASSNSLYAILVYGTGTDQPILGSGFTGAVTAGGITPSLTTSWQRFSFTVSIPSTATQVGPRFAYTPTGTAGANDWFQITGVQLEIAPQATPFSRAGGSIGGELALCQGYYYQVTGSNGSGGIAIDIAVGQVLASNQIDFLWQFPVTMRAVPSISASSGSNYFLAYTYSGLYYVNTISASYDQSIYSTRLRLAPSGATGGQGAILGTVNALAYLAASAEL